MAYSDNLQKKEKLKHRFLICLISQYKWFTTLHDFLFHFLSKCKKCLFFQLKIITHNFPYKKQSEFTSKLPIFKYCPSGYLMVTANKTNWIGNSNLLNWGISVASNGHAIIHGMQRIPSPWHVTIKMSVTRKYKNKTSFFLLIYFHKK